VTYKIENGDNVSAICSPNRNALKCFSTNELSTNREGGLQNSGTLHLFKY